MTSIGKMVIDSDAGVVKLLVSDRALPGLMRDSRFTFERGKDGVIGSWGGDVVVVMPPKGEQPA